MLANIKNLANIKKLAKSKMSQKKTIGKNQKIVKNQNFGTISSINIFLVFESSDLEPGYEVTDTIHLADFASDPGTDPSRAWRSGFIDFEFDLNGRIFVASSLPARVGKWPFSGFDKILKITVTFWVFS